MIDTTVSGDGPAVLHLRGLGPAVLAQVRAGVGREAIALQAKIKAEKLSGQALKVRTGTLRRSIDQVVRETGPVIDGAVGTNVKYAKRHEYGMHGTVSVKAHLRTIKQAFGKHLRAPKQISVRAHSMKVDYPEHSFLRTALQEMKQPFIEAMRDAANRGVSK